MKVSLGSKNQSQDTGNIMTSKIRWPLYDSCGDNANIHGWNTRYLHFNIKASKQQTYLSALAMAAFNCTPWTAASHGRKHRCFCFLFCVFCFLKSGLNFSSFGSSVLRSEQPEAASFRPVTAVIPKHLRLITEHVAAEANQHDPVSVWL